MKIQFIRIAVSLVFLLSFFAFSEKKEKSLKVLTYNIHHANPPGQGNLIDLEAIARVIKESGADMVALQEVDVRTLRSGKDLDQAVELGRLTQMHSYFVKGIDYEGGEYGIAILSKFPFLSTDSLRLPMSAGSGGEPRVLAMVTVEPRSGEKLIFASTHLDLKLENRLLQTKAIIDHLSSQDLPVILGGDFNALPNSEVMTRFDQYFKRSSIPNGYTIPVLEPTREIDFVVFRPESKFEIGEHRVIQERYASDHLPVYVELGYY